MSKIGLRFYNFLKFYKAPLLSGVLFGCSFIPFPFFTLFFALVPLWLFMYRQTSLKKVIIACLLCQSLSTFIGFNWMIYTFHSFGGLNWFLSFIFFILFCVVGNVFMLCSGILWFVLSKKSPSTPVRLILLPLLFSLLHSLIPTVLPWNMGYPWLWGGWPGLHTAELWGFRFLSALSYVFNLLFLIAYKHSPFLKIKKQSKGRSLSLPHPDPIGKKALLGAISLFIFLNSLGFYLKKSLRTPDQSLNAIVIQPNIGSIPLINPRPFNRPETKALHVLKNLTYNALKQTRKQLQREEIDLIVWPEGAYGWIIHKNSKTEKHLSKLARTIKIPLITGAITKDHGGYSNSLVLLDRKGHILQPIYDKTKLLIFGEYFPLIDKFPFLRKLFPYFGSNLRPGKSPQVQKIENTRLGYQICYESLFDSLSRKLAQKKAQVLINITNDSWYGSWQEPYQHLIMNFARAIEVRRPLIRSTNTGYSGVILADGTVQSLQTAPGTKNPSTHKLKLLPMNQARFGLYSVPYYKNPPKTLFMSWGYYCHEMLLLFLTLLAGGIHFLKMRKTKGTLKN